nr:RHS repeat protein [Pseudomonas californiensis]
MTQLRFDCAGRAYACRDPRFFMRSASAADAPANQVQTFSLSGTALLTKNVDAGWQLALLNEAGAVSSQWDGRSVRGDIEYDAAMRPVMVTEEGHVTERFTYGGPATYAHNQCNQLMRHDDTAGSLHRPDYAVCGPALTERRHFLNGLDLPDWPPDEQTRELLVEPAGLATQWAFNALGEAISQTDAMGNTQASTKTGSGNLQSVSLWLSDADEPVVLVRNMVYNAFGQVEQETAGNTVVTEYTYDTQDGQLDELRILLPGESPLQHFKYRYNPAGNMLEMQDAAQPVRFFANRRIEPINRYTYDTLYQLTEATGREVETGARYGPALPDLQTPPDPNQMANYTQQYDYDPSGNLLQMRHVGAQSFTRTMHVDPGSNRSICDDGSRDGICRPLRRQRQPVATCTWSGAEVGRAQPVAADHHRATSPVFKRRRELCV